MTMMRVVGECFFWYRLTRVFPDKFHRAVKRLCVVCFNDDDDDDSNSGVLECLRKIIAKNTLSRMDVAEIRVVVVLFIV